MTSIKQNKYGLGKEEERQKDLRTVLHAEQVGQVTVPLE